jgi:sulfur relay (sulfurtransferase) DsrC/TusE family protein
MCATSLPLGRPTLDEEGKYLQKAFRKVDGDMAPLLAAAIGWRDAMCQQHWGITAPHRVFHKKQANSSTGFPGVRKVVKTVKKQCTDGTVAEYKIPCIIAEIWLEPGKNERRAKKSRSKVFSLNKFSVEDALPVGSDVARGTRNAAAAAASTGS